MSRNKQEYRVGIGASSMLMIFIVLCLTTLAILALSSARTDSAMTDRNIKIVGDYYAAVNEAQSAIAQIDGSISAIREAALDEAQYMQMLEGLSIDGYQITHSDGRLLSFSIGAGNDSMVDVTLQAAAFGEMGERYRVLRHTLTYIDNWEFETDLKLFTGEAAAGVQGSDDIEFILD